MKYAEQFHLETRPAIRIRLQTHSTEVFFRNGLSIRILDGSIFISEYVVSVSSLYCATFDRAFFSGYFFVMV